MRYRFARALVLFSAALAGAAAIFVGLADGRGVAPAPHVSESPGEPPTLALLRSRAASSRSGYVTVRLLDRDGVPWTPPPYERRWGANEPVLGSLDGGLELAAYVAEPRGRRQSWRTERHVVQPQAPDRLQPFIVMDDGILAVRVPRLMWPRNIEDVFLMPVGGDPARGWFHAEPVHVHFEGPVSWPPVEIRAQAEPPLLVPLDVEITGDTAFGDDPDESVLVEWADTEVPLLTASPVDARCAFELPPGRYRVRALRRQETSGEIPVRRGEADAAVDAGAPERVILDVGPVMR